MSGDELCRERVSHPSRTLGLGVVKARESPVELRIPGLWINYELIIQVYCEFESYQNRIHTQRMMHVATLFNVATLLFKIPDTREHTIVRE